MKMRQKPKSVNTLRTKNKILKSFINGNGFGFDYYLDNKGPELGVTEYKEPTIEDRTLSGKTNSTNAKSFKNEGEDINEQVDKMLNYYISKLNENIEDSCDSLNEDESMGGQFPSVNNILNSNTNIVRNGTTSMGNINVNNLSEIKPKETSMSPGLNQSSTIHNVLAKDSPPTRDNNNSTNHDVNLGNNISSFTHSKNASKKDISVEPISHVEEADHKLNQENMPEISPNKSHKTTQNFEENIEEEIEGKITKTSPNKAQVKQEIYEKDNLQQNNSKVDTDKNKKSPKQVKEVEPIKMVENHDHSHNKAQGQDQNEEIDEFAHIRLNKSCEDTYLRQRMDQFDIEYMCRCLGLAVMKHLESGKENQHILDLVDIKENFSFFDSLYNSNINFFNTFFNIENQMNKISNLDQLDLNNRQNSENVPISYMSRVKSSDGQNDEPLEIKEEDIEKEINTINEYFNKSSKPSGKYKNLHPKTQNIMSEGLNAISEMDSAKYCKDNLLFTVEHKKDPKPVDYFNVLKESLVKFSGADEECENADIEDKEQKGVGETISPELKEKKDDQEGGEEYDFGFEDIQVGEILDENEEVVKPVEENKDLVNKFSSVQQSEVEPMPETPMVKKHDIPIEEEEPNLAEEQQQPDEVFESGIMESNYVIDVNTAEKLKSFLLKTVEIYDDDYSYAMSKIPHRKYMRAPDPQGIFEFCANIMMMTKMEKEVIIICLIYIERFIFNTGLLINSRNWRRLLFTCLIVASKIWDDDSFENNHFAQVFPHLQIGEINLMERTFLELINYKVYVKCSEYFKYFFIVKSIALKYNFNGFNLVPISVERMMKIQEYAYSAQKKLRKKYSCYNSAEF